MWSHRACRARCLRARRSASDQVPSVSTHRIAAALCSCFISKVLVVGVPLWCCPRLVLCWFLGPGPCPSQHVLHLTPWPALQGSKEGLDQSLVALVCRALTFAIVVVCFPGPRLQPNRPVAAIGIPNAPFRAPTRDLSHGLWCSCWRWVRAGARRRGRGEGARRRSWSRCDRAAICHVTGTVVLHRAATARGVAALRCCRYKPFPASPCSMSCWDCLQLPSGAAYYHYYLSMTYPGLTTASSPSPRSVPSTARRTSPLTWPTAPGTGTCTRPPPVRQELRRAGVRQRHTRRATHLRSCAWRKCLGAARRCWGSGRKVGGGNRGNEVQG